MFDSHYPFNYRFNQINRDDETIISHDLHFTCSNDNKYVVVVDQYQEGFFVIQFYLWRYKKYKNKYLIKPQSKSSNVRVISTCFHIMLYFLRKYPYASFAFQGILDPDEHTKSTCVDQSKSQRYRIYEYMVVSLISKDSFDHADRVEQNAYLLINRNDPRPNILEIMEDRYISKL